MAYTERPRRQYGSGGIAQRSSDGRWVGSIEAGRSAITGKRRRIYVTAKTEAECKRRLRDRRKAIEREGLPAQGSRPTVEQWAKAWQAQRVHVVRPATHTQDCSVQRRWIIPIIGHRRLDSLTPADLRALETAQREAGRAVSSMQRTRSVLDRMLKDAVVEGHHVPERMLHIRRAPVEDSDRDALTTDQALAVLHAAGRTPDGSRWVAALAQGMRQEECLGLTWDAVDLDAGVIDVRWQLQELPYNEPRRPKSGFRVPDGYVARHLVRRFHLVRPKTKRGHRQIPLVEPLALALRTWREQSPASYGLVWTRDDGMPYRADEDRPRWYALQDAAGVRHPSGRRYFLHEARNTTATLLLEAGVDPEVIKAVLGHSNIVTSRGYMTVRDAMTRQAMERVASALRLES